VTAPASTRGIEGIVIETHNWGKTVAFWKALGYVLEFQTDHNSGQLRHPGGGPYLFVLEVPPDQPATFQPTLGCDTDQGFQAPNPDSIERPFTDQHWGVREMMLRDPDGRRVSIQAPLPSRAR
jgi:hypothetical protein